MATPISNTTDALANVLESETTWKVVRESPRSLLLMDEDEGSIYKLEVKLVRSPEDTLTATPPRAQDEEFDVSLIRDEDLL